MYNWRKWFVVLFMLSVFITLFVIHFTKNEDRQEQIKKKMFDDYIKKHGKSYINNSTEYATRFVHFKESLEEINNLNRDLHEKDTAKYGLTYLSDLSRDEFQSIHLSDEKIKQFPKQYKYKLYNSIIDNNKVYERRKRVAELPQEFDWRERGVIGPVKTQGVCGACWAFSTINTVEAMVAIKTGKLNALSVQEVIDCARGGNTGCWGGDICLLLNWLWQTKTPIELEAEYPLRLMDGTCRLKENATGVKVQGFSCESMVGSEKKKLIEKIATFGPVAVAVNAITWQHYMSGVIQYHCSGRLTDLNHAIQLVGYNLNAEVPYFIGKNSWGKEFGEDGYVKLAIGDNICGLANEVASVNILI